MIHLYISYCIVFVVVKLFGYLDYQMFDSELAMLCLLDCIRYFAADFIITLKNTLVKDNNL